MASEPFGLTTHVAVIEDLDPSLGPTPARTCECWAVDHRWADNGTCDLTAMRRVNVKIFCTNCSNGGAPHNLVYLFCGLCAREVTSDLPPGVVDARDVGPL